MLRTRSRPRHVAANRRKCSATFFLFLKSGKSRDCGLGCVISPITSKRHKSKPLAAYDFQGSPQRTSTPASRPSSAARPDCLMLLFDIERRELDGAFLLLGKSIDERPLLRAVNALIRQSRPNGKISQGFEACRPKTGFRFAGRMTGIAGSCRAWMAASPAV